MKWFPIDVLPKRAASSSAQAGGVRARRLYFVVTLLVFWVLGGRWSDAAIEFPIGDVHDPITVHAASATRWRQGQYDVWQLQGAVQIRQGTVQGTAREAILWIDSAPNGAQQSSKIIAYLEGGATVDFIRPGDQHAVSKKPAQSVSGEKWIARFQTVRGIRFETPPSILLQGAPPPIWRRALAARESEHRSVVQQAQFTTEELETPPGRPSFGARRVRIFPRSNIRVQANTHPSPTTPGEQIGVISTGVQVSVEGLSIEGQPDIDSVSIAADRTVFWITGGEGLDRSGQAGGGGSPSYEFYLEGNIVFRQGDRVVYADRMYYNVEQEQGVILNAELLGPAGEYQGMVRLKADVLQQLDRQHFLAHGAAVTSSLMGVPTYWLQSETMVFEDRQQASPQAANGQVAVHPLTGAPAVKHERFATARNNFIYAMGVPVFYWPVLATDLTRPTYYVDQFQVKTDSVFGTQLLLDFDMYQLLGWRDPPEDTKWTVTTDYLSDRGLALGTTFQYDRFNQTPLGTPGRYFGYFDAWGLNDTGLDNLGADRRSLTPSQNFRGRLRGQHRQYLANGFSLSAELGVISDRNFLEQYYEQEWDQLKDQTTGLELKRLVEHSSWSFSGDVNVNKFLTQTQGVRFDHFLMGQSVLDKGTWFAHSQIGYADMEIASAPTDPADAAKFALRPWETDSEGLRTSTRNEIDLPLEVGAVKVVPYALGELAYWGQDIAGSDVTRAYGQAGVRASMPMWKSNPAVQSQLLNLNGIAHKVVFEGEFFYADANQDLSRFPLYDPLDDDAQEQFRRRFAVDTFGGFIPPAFDERLYALRTGMQGWVAAPSTEIADDLTLGRISVQQRWQTKRGLPGHERTVDWITLDVQGSVFPEANRDNFGQEIGMLNYDARWHVGDRFTLLSDGFLDVFSNGFRTFSVGALSSRPASGNVYLGFRSLEGPITSNIVTASVDYRMSEKWIGRALASVDLGPTGNIGQSLAVTRIGESFLFQVGLNIDASRDNVSLIFKIEPRFLKGKLSRVGGVNIPPAGPLGF